MRSIRPVCLRAAVMFLSAIALSAQDQPDFTGTWTRLDSSLSPNSRHVERIAQTGGQLRVEREGSETGGPLGLGYHDDHTYTIGGPLQSKEDPDGRVRSVAVSWDGPKLIFLRTTTEGANTTTEREAWSLGDGGDMLFKDRRTTDWRGTRDERVVFQRSKGKPGGFRSTGRPASRVGLG